MTTPSLTPVGRAEQPGGQRAPVEHGLLGLGWNGAGCSGLLPLPLPSVAGLSCGPPGWVPPLVFRAGTSPPEPLCRNCQLLSPSAQPAEQLSLLTQNLETYFLFHLHLVFSVLTL